MNSKAIFLLMTAVFAGGAIRQWWISEKRGRAAFLDSGMAYDRNDQPMLFKVARWFWLSLAILAVLFGIVVAFANA